jgi:hypothetical protein
MLEWIPPRRGYFDYAQYKYANESFAEHPLCGIVRELEKAEICPSQLGGCDPIMLYKLFNKNFLMSSEV